MVNQSDTLHSTPEVLSERKALNGGLGHLMGTEFGNCAAQQCWSQVPALPCTLHRSHSSAFTSLLSI